MNDILMEIAELIDANLTKDDQWCIIDDRTDIIPGQPFFRIDYETGLTDEDTNKVINYFKNLES